MATSFQAQSETSALSRSVEPHDLQAILKAIEAFDITTTPAWDTLDELSTHTEVVGLDASPDAVFSVKDSKRFEAIGNVYVTLNFGGRRDEGLTMGESFPAHILGSLDEDGRASIDSVEIDTSAFFDSAGASG